MCSLMCMYNYIIYLICYQIKLQHDILSALNKTETLSFQAHIVYNCLVKTHNFNITPFDKLEEPALFIKNTSEPQLHTGRVLTQ